MPPPDPERRADAGEHQLRLGTERQRGADWVSPARLAGRHDDRHAVAAVLAGPHSAQPVRAETRMTLASAHARRRISPAALCAPRAARRLARLSHLRRLHRARRHGDRRRRLVLAQPHRWARARRPRHPRRRSGVHADPARGRARRNASFSMRAARFRSAPRCARWRAPATAASALVELKAVDGAYPLFGTVTLDPAMPLARALAQRDGAFGAAVDPTLLARLDLKPGARLTVGAATIEIAAAHPERARQARQRHRLRPARDRQRGGAARDRPAACPAAWCAGTTACGCRTAATAPPTRSIAAAERATAGCRLGDSHPHQRVAGAGAQRRALHPVPHAGRPDRAAGRRRRRRQRGEEPHRPQARRRSRR